MNTTKKDGETSSSVTFADLGLSKEILAAVEKKGFTNPSPIQAGVIPLLLKGERDIIGQAQTGTGKTAAFTLPLLERLDPKKKRTQAIVLAPTRELAIQVSKEMQSFGVENSPTTTVVYGGNNMSQEIFELKKNPQIVVGTPGRMQHHIRNGNLSLDDISYFVLDEADEMLNFGFREEIEEILEMTPPQRKVLLFSATMPRSILEIVNRYMKEYDTVKIEAKEMTNENITQKYYCVQPHDKFETLCRIMEEQETFYAIVFCRTKSDTDFIASQLTAKHLRAEAIHGDIDQNHREKILARFKDRKTNILVATDVAARGIDIADLNFVVNYSLPETYEIYTHRIGRTGRAGNKGTAVTFISGKEMGRLRFFERNLKVQMEKGILPEPKDLVAKKKNHLVERLEHIINNENISNLQDFAQQLLEEGEAVDIIAALLKDGYAGDFDIKKYRIIYEDTPRDGRAPSRSSRRQNYGKGFSRNGGGRDRGGYRGGRNEGGRSDRGGERGDRGSRGRDDRRGGSRGGSSSYQKRSRY